MVSRVDAASHRSTAAGSSDTTRSTIESTAGRCVTTTIDRPRAARCSDEITRASVSRVEMGGRLVEEEQ